MHDAMRMGIRDSAGQLLDQCCRFPSCQRTIGQSAGQRLPRNKLERQKRAAGILPDLEDLDDARMLQSSGRPRLAQKSRALNDFGQCTSPK